jgi:hypothetical protein
MILVRVNVANAFIRDKRSQLYPIFSDYEEDGSSDLMRTADTRFGALSANIVIGNSALLL